MTGEHTPGTGPDENPPDGVPGEPGLDGAQAELRVLSRRLRDLRGEFDRIKRLHTELAASVSEQLGPDLAALRDFATSELGELRAAVDELLKEQQKAKNPPVDWFTLSKDDAAKQWPILASWVGTVLVPWYELTRGQLPDCWALHRPVVIELSWLRSAHVQAYLTATHPHITAEWHARWRHTVLERIKQVIDEQKCRPGEHLVSKEESHSRLPPPPASAVAGPMPTPARKQLAEPQHWWRFYSQAYHADLAWRGASQPERSWTPQPSPPASRT